MLIQNEDKPPHNWPPIPLQPAPSKQGSNPYIKGSLNHPPSSPYPRALGLVEGGETGLGFPQVGQMGRVWVPVGRVESGISRTPMEPYFECNPLKAFLYTLCTPYRTLSRNESQSIRAHISLRLLQIQFVHQGHSKLHNYSFAPTMSQESQKTRTPRPSWT